MFKIKWQVEFLWVICFPDRLCYIQYFKMNVLIESPGFVPLIWDICKSQLQNLKMRAISLSEHMGTLTGFSWCSPVPTHGCQWCPGVPGALSTGLPTLRSWVLTVCLLGHSHLCEGFGWQLAQVQSCQGSWAKPLLVRFMLCSWGIAQVTFLNALPAYFERPGVYVYINRELPVFRETYSSSYVRSALCQKTQGRAW